MTFTPTEYVGDEPRKALRLTVNKEFTIVNNGGGLEINFNDNLAEVDKFYFYSTNTAMTTLNIDLAEHKASSLFINELRGSEKNKGNVVFNFASKNKYAPSIEIIGFKIKPVEDVLNKSFVYPLFEIGGGDFKALESVVSLPPMLMNEDDSSLFEIRSLKGDIILTNSEINMLQTNEGKSSSLEARNDISFATASVEVCGAIVVNGKIQSSAFPNQRNRTIINLNNSTSQSNLFFKPKNKNALYFNIKDSNLDNGSKSIFIIRDVTLVGVNLKNDPKKDITFANTTVKYSNLFNVSNLCECAIYKTHVENFNLKIDSKNEKIFSYGPVVEGMALTEIEKKITNLLKNTEIELKGADYFRDRTNGSLSITNCVIKGQTKESTFSDATINSENLELKIDGSAISKSSINFTGSSEKDSISKVEHATAFKSILNNISGDLRGTTIFWMKANNITLGKNTSFYHTLLRDTWPKLDYLLNLDNITIAPDSSLHFDYGKDFARSLNNCYVEGKVSIESNCPYEINSSTIKNNNDEESTIFISSNGGNPLIESVLFNGDVEIKNVDELSYSEISNSKLLSPYRVNASNLFLCDETITNFDADNIEHKVDSTVTNELDIL